MGSVMTFSDTHEDMQTQLNFKDISLGCNQGCTALQVMHFLFSHRDMPSFCCVLYVPVANSDQTPPHTHPERSDYDTGITVYCNTMKNVN